MSSYCSASDVKRQVPPGSFPNPGRLVSSVNASTNLLTLGQHGLAANEAVTLRADAGGTMPTGLTAGTTYYALVVSESTFQLSTTSGGAAIDITAAGSNVVLVRDLPFATWIEAASGLIEQTLPAHVMPIDESAVPIVVREIVAKYAALAGLIHVGAGTIDIERQIQSSQAQVDRWVKEGRPIKGTNAPASSQLALSSSVSSADRRGWVRDGDDTRIP